MRLPLILTLCSILSPSCSNSDDTSTPETLFEWPLRQNSNFDDYSYYYISNYVDHDPTSVKLDYNGGDRTYNDHEGTDIVSYPFWWKKMDENQVEVIAAAGGIIINKDDGHYDQNCAWGSPNSNFVTLFHPDATISIYKHLKMGSVITKSVGESVITGELLGYVGSSGNSDKPHLHFEVHKDGEIIDPFDGLNNNTVNHSLWVNQPPYYDSGINKILIGSEEADITGSEDNPCPHIEQTYEHNMYCQGDKITFTRYYRHPLENQQTICTVYKPDGTVWLTWNHNQTEDKKKRSAWNNRVLPLSAPVGTWKFVANYLGSVYEKEFEVTDCSN